MKIDLNTGIPAADLQVATSFAARAIHEVWMARRAAEGWRKGPCRDDRRKEHPCMVTWDELPDGEKEYDRVSAREALTCLASAGWRIVPPAHEYIADYPPEVTDFRSGWYRLENDLGSLQRLAGQSANEGMIFYGARILEFLVNDAIVKLGLKPCMNVFSSLDRLSTCGGLTGAGKYWAHALRRLGNAARHLHRPLGAKDADLAIVLVDVWLEWFFCTFSRGPCLPAFIKRPGARFQAYHRLMHIIDLDPCPAPHEVEQTPCFYSNAAFPATYAERLIAHGRHPEAISIIESGLRHFPDDNLRLRQLKGLALSRNGYLDEALDILSTLYAEDPENPETAGIFAGASKRKWFQEEKENPTSAVHWLKHCADIYKKAWIRGGKMNVYLGINHAATTLWCGNRDEACMIAGEVCSLVEEERRLWGRNNSTDFWSDATFAEAALLAGDTNTAKTLYSTLAMRWSGDANKGQRCVAQGQLRRHLRLLGFNQADAEEWIPFHS